MNGTSDFLDLIDFPRGHQIQRLSEKQASCMSIEIKVHKIMVAHGQIEKTGQHCLT